MKAAARANVKFGNELLDVANGNVTQANDAFRRYYVVKNICFNSSYKPSQHINLFIFHCHKD